MIEIKIAIRKDGTFLDGLLGAHRHGGKEKERQRIYEEKKQKDERA
jgi:hypothetical protein